MPGSVGTIIVDGIDSFLGSGGLEAAGLTEIHQIIIGRQGSGLMSITNGGTVLSEATQSGATNFDTIGAVIGSDPQRNQSDEIEPGGRGEVNVIGPYSRWIVGGSHANWRISGRQRWRRRAFRHESGIQQRSGARHAARPGRRPGAHSARNRRPSRRRRIANADRSVWPRGADWRPNSNGISRYDDGQCPASQRRRDRRRRTNRHRRIPQPPLGRGPCRSRRETFNRLRLGVPKRRPGGTATGQLGRHSGSW